MIFFKKRKGEAMLKSGAARTEVMVLEGAREVVRQRALASRPPRPGPDWLLTHPLCPRAAAVSCAGAVLLLPGRGRASGACIRSDRERVVIASVCCLDMEAERMHRGSQSRGRGLAQC